MSLTLILLRHGESEWNAKNLFTGWVDVDPPDLVARSDFGSLGQIDDVSTSAPAAHGLQAAGRVAVGGLSELA